MHEEIAKLLGQKVFEIEVREEGDPESASGAQEVEITFETGKTLLIYVDREGNMQVEVD